MVIGNAIVMPKLGLTMSEGVLSEWVVAVGDKVDAGQILFVVETDKLATEVEATGPGEILELIAEAGATYTVGEVIARWSGEVL
jgi:pyruvate dehydrogenase E2 component (dihydrolipoamide acetyltransferase)